MNKVFGAMGTVISLAGNVPDDTVAAVADRFEELEARFSLYRPESEASRLARHELRLTKASKELRQAYDLATSWRSATEGAFSPHRPDGRIDFNGVVKAMAIQRAGECLDAAGVERWLVNAGGDVLSRGTTGRPWRVGIVDPADRAGLLTRFITTAERPAVATSGVQERGEHIWRLGSDPTFVQVSVAASDIVTADVLATAILSGGPGTLDLAISNWPIEVLAVTASGGIRASDGFRR